MKIGRNQPCPCGSGKKYKKCCLTKDSSVPDMDQIMAMKADLDRLSAARRASLRQHGIFIDFPSPTHFKGQSIWALGSRVYYGFPPDISFHEFLIMALGDEMGREWVDEQKKLPLEQQHFVVRCHSQYVEWRKKQAPKESGDPSLQWSGIADGWTKSLIALAFDVACIIHVHGHIPEKLLARLRLTDSNYQGARYEIATAAIFARMGCKFEFLDETLDHLRTTPGHCEFFATDPDTDTVVAVEAKSKVRKGILHEPGQSQNYQLWNNVTGPYRNALSQNPDTMPFFVFVDMNCPPTPGIPLLAKPWVKEILENRKKISVNKPGNPDPCTGIIYTNYSYHYQTTQEAKANEALLIIPDYPKYSAPESFLNKLNATVTGYSHVPNIGFDGKVYF